MRDSEVLNVDQAEKLAAEGNRIVLVGLSGRRVCGDEPFVWCHSGAMEEFCCSAALLDLSLSL